MFMDQESRRTLKAMCMYTVIIRMISYWKLYIYLYMYIVCDAPDDLRRWRIVVIRNLQVNPGGSTSEDFPPLIEQIQYFLLSL